MSETLLLHLQTHENLTNPSKPEKPYSLQLVTGVELPDGQHLRGRSYRPNMPEEAFTLEWSSDKAERVAAYYDEYLTRSTDSPKGWSCHSFVVDVMDWDVRWDKGAGPYDMPYDYQEVDPSRLKDQQPYALAKKFSGLQHSMMGLPDPELNLGVWGFKSNLHIATNEVTMDRYGGAIYRHRQAVPRKIGRIATRLFGLSETLPTSIS